MENDRTREISSIIEPYLSSPLPREVSAEVDAKGKFCPIPLVLLGKALKEVPSQGVVMISATDPGFLPDLFSWIQTRPYEVVAIRIEGGIFRAWVKKGDPLEGFPPG